MGIAEYNDSDSLTIGAVLLKYVMSCSAALVAETATYPLDITKTRLQVASNLDSSGNTFKTSARKSSKGMLRVAYEIARNEGITSLWRGVEPAIYRHYIYTGMRMGCYEVLRSQLYDKKKEINFPIWKSMACGLFSGALAQFVASPADLVKVKMQMEGLRLENRSARFRNTWHAFSVLYRLNGFRSLWTGWVPNCQRAALLNMADLATYDRSKRWLMSKGMGDSAVTHACCSCLSGLAAAIVSTPADVVKTRIMDQICGQDDNKPIRGNRRTHYKGSIDCLVNIVRHEGFLSLYNGFIPTYIRMAPWSLTFWVSYEKIRYLMGTDSF